MNEKVQLYWQQFSSWFTILSTAKKIWFGLLVFFLLTGGWLISLVIAIVWFFIDKNSQEKQKKLSQRLSEAKAYLDPIITSKKLPVLNVDINLQKGEECSYIEENTQLAEERSVRLTRGNGASFRVMKGVWVHSYGSKGAIKKQLTQIDSGTIFLTNKRLIFLGKLENRNIKYSDILATHQYSDAISLSLSSNGKNEFFFVKNPFLVKGMLTLSPYGDKLKAFKKIDMQYQLG